MESTKEMGARPHVGMWQFCEGAGKMLGGCGKSCDKKEASAVQAIQVTFIPRK